jgi:hypothetical protein
MSKASPCLWPLDLFISKEQISRKEIQNKFNPGITCCNLLKNSNIGTQKVLTNLCADKSTHVSVTNLPLAKYLL